MHITSDTNFAKKLFDDIVDHRFAYLFDDVSDEEKHALRNLFSAEANYVIDDIKTRILNYKERLDKHGYYIVYYRFPHNNGSAEMLSDWQSALESAVKIYHTQPNAIIEIYDGMDKKRYTHDDVCAIIKYYYIVTRKTGDRDFECSNSYLTIEGQSINAFNMWLLIDGEGAQKIDQNIFDTTDAVIITGKKNGYTYSISKHKMI